MTRVLKKEKEQIAGGVVEGALGRDNRGMESESQPTHPSERAL